MGVLGSSANDPNARQYKLLDENGEKFTLRTGAALQGEFNLAAAIGVANYQAGFGLQLYVVDPESDAVLWAGERTTR